MTSTSTSRTREALVERLLEHLDNASGKFPDHPKPSRSWWHTTYHLVAAIRTADAANLPRKDLECPPSSTPTPSPKRPTWARLLKPWKR